MKRNLNSPDGAEDLTTYTAASALKVIERKLPGALRVRLRDQLNILWEFVALVEQTEDADESVGGCSCGFRARTTEELIEHAQAHEDEDHFLELVEQANRAAGGVTESKS